MDCKTETGCFKFETWPKTMFVEQRADNNESFMLTAAVHDSRQSRWKLTRYFDKTYTARYAKNIYIPLQHLSNHLFLRITL